MKDWIVVVVLIVIVSVLTVVGFNMIYTEIRDNGLKSIVSEIWEGEG